MACSYASAAQMTRNTSPIGLRCTETSDCQITVTDNLIQYNLLCNVYNLTTQSHVYNHRLLLVFKSTPASGG